MSNPFRILRPGALVGVIAPAGPSSAERRARVEPLLARHGLRARLYPSCFQDLRGYLAGTDAQRLADLHAALADDEVAALICLRGGYGCGRLLAAIDTTLVRTQHKLLVGYSDITALHALFNREGVPSLHAPMLGSDLAREGRMADEEALFALLMQGLPAGDVPRAELLTAPRLELLQPGAVAEGRLLGGNLSLVASLMGTPWALPAGDAGGTDGTILFLEDINEELYRVDRLLGQLKNAGVFDAVRGVLLGSFTDAASPVEVLRDYLEPLVERGVPVLAGWPAGHGTPNRALPLGARVRLDAAAAKLTLLEDFLV